MATLDHTPGTGCVVLGDEIVYFEAGKPAIVGKPVLVIDRDGALVVVEMTGSFSAATEDRGFAYVRLAGDDGRSRSKVPLVGAVTRVIAMNTAEHFPIAAEVARGLTTDANQGDTLRQRIKDAIFRAARDGLHHIAIELRNTPDDDRRALNKELWDAGFNPTISERPLKQVLYGDEADIYLLTVSWAHERT
jgi:hypothetical protein